MCMKRRLMCWDHVDAVCSSLPADTTMFSHQLMQLLEEKGVTCIDSEGTPRCADIVAFPKSAREGFVLEPTVRYECNEENQAQAVDEK